MGQQVGYTFTLTLNNCFYTNQSQIMLALSLVPVKGPCEQLECGCVHVFVYLVFFSWLLLLLLLWLLLFHVCVCVCVCVYVCVCVRACVRVLSLSLF